MTKAIIKIHFNVLKPLKNNFELLSVIVSLSLFALTYSIIEKLEYEGTFLPLFLFIIIFSIPIIYIIQTRLSRDEVIAKASISPKKIELGNEVFKFDEIQMCWIHFGIINKLRENDIMDGFEDYYTLQMLILLKNGEKKTYHIENKREYPKLLSELLFDLKRENKLSKLQFHESVKFDVKEFERRMKLKNQLSKTAHLRKYRKLKSRK